MIEALDGAAPQRKSQRRAPLSSDTVRFMRPGAAAPKADTWISEPLPAAAVPSAAPVRSPPRAIVPHVEPGPAAVPHRASKPEGCDAPAFAALAAELEAQDEVPVTRTRRRYLVAVGGVAALVTIGLVAANLQGRSNDAQRAPVLVPRDFPINDSPGKSLPDAKSSAAAAPQDLDSSVSLAPQVAPAPAVASSDSTPPRMHETRKSPAPTR